MKYLNILLIVLPLVFFGSCKEQELMNPEIESALYFENKDYGQKDSISQSFFNLNSSIQSYDVYVIVNTMGEISNVDRPISIIQSNLSADNAAKPGIHYIAFDDPSMREHMIIPANKTTVRIPITLLKDPSMDTKEFKLEMEVAKNDYFQPGINAFRKFLIKTTAIALKPTNWDTFWINYFGQTWGPVKMKFIIDTIGEIPWDESIDMGYGYWMGETVAGALHEYNVLHPDSPLTEADGTPVTI